MKKYGIAVWGLGNHAHNKIIPALSSVEELSLIGVCSRTKTKVLESSKKWNCIGWLDSTKMLENPKVEIVFIASPIGVHYKMARDALLAGKHVWCEKPLTCNDQHTRELVQLAKERKKNLNEGFMYLYHPQFKKLKQFIQNVSFGHVHSVVCRFGIPTLSNLGFRADPALCGGALWDVASYTVSALIALFPNESIKVIFAEINTKNGSNVDTDGRAILRFSNNTSVYIEWAIGVAYKNEIELWSDKGTIFTDKIFSKPDNYRPIFETRDMNGNKASDYSDVADQFKEMLIYFSSMFDNPELLKKEYASILARSKLMSKIIKKSDSKK